MKPQLLLLNEWFALKPTVARYVSDHSCGKSIEYP